jgi:hypothetical protein
MLRKAYGQARSYVTHLPGDDASLRDGPRRRQDAGGLGPLGRGLWRLRRWQAHRPPHPPRARPGHRPAPDIWAQPQVRNPRARAQASPRPSPASSRAGRLAGGAGFGQERVSRFLMRCVFTMFAEDVRLLPDEPFLQLIDDGRSRSSRRSSSPAVEELWRAMDGASDLAFASCSSSTGTSSRTPRRCPSTRPTWASSSKRREADWSDVEPAIFGTLLTRALDPRSATASAPSTPRRSSSRAWCAPTVEEPIRERWTAVQAEVLQLRESGGRRAARTRKVAEQRLRDFHDWLRSLQLPRPGLRLGQLPLCDHAHGQAHRGRGLERAQPA